MAHPRTALRTLGVLAAATGLAIAGAGVASATTSEGAVDGNKVSVTFALEDSDTLGDACTSVLVPPAAVTEVLAGLNGDTTETEITPASLPDFGSILNGLLSPLEDINGVIILRNGDNPYVVLTSSNDEGTVSAADVPSNLYLQANICASDLADATFAPDLSPVLVGNPLAALSAMSSDGLLDTASALVSGGDEGGLGAILSSGLGEDDLTEGA